MNLNEADKQYLIDLIRNNNQIPEDYKHLLFPSLQEEYELTYAGKMRKGKVKLIYIDPPFATQEEFQTKEGAKAYSDKKKGAEFLEFIRRRLILAKEILAPDGAIYVHLDQKMGHYVKVILDEVFGKNNIRNEIIWCYKTSLRSSPEKIMT